MNGGQDLLLANLCRGVPNVRKQGRRKPRVENRSDYEAGSGMDTDVIVDAELGR